MNVARSIHSTIRAKCQAHPLWNLGATYMESWVCIHRHHVRVVLFDPTHHCNATPSGHIGGHIVFGSLIIHLLLNMSNYFSVTGERPNDFWLVNDSREFSVLSGGTIAKFASDIPIFLKVGNLSFGERHIAAKHSVWVKKQSVHSVAELVYLKLEHSGEIYCTEVAHKIKIIMRLKPSAIMVMQYDPNPEPHFSIVTLYFHQDKLDGSKIGRYRGRGRWIQAF